MNSIADNDYTTMLAKSARGCVSLCSLDLALRTLVRNGAAEGHTEDSVGIFELREPS